MKLLLNHGADIHHKDNDGYSCLHVACSSGHLDIVKLLVAHGADIHHKYNNVSSCLYLACSSGHLDIVKLLIAHGAGFDELLSMDGSPVHSFEGMYNQFKLALWYRSTDSLASAIVERY